jgi:hypothetical protein
MQQAVAAVAAVIEAKKRINIDTNKTFYSILDRWQYITLGDDKVCDLCSPLDGEEYTGAWIRTKFPFHTVDNEDVISVHRHMPRDDNCRCILMRSSLFFNLPTVEEP